MGRDGAGADRKARQAASEELMQRSKLWETGSKAKETPIKDGNFRRRKGKDRAKKRPRVGPENDF
jgi:hypothetical protein